MKKTFTMIILLFVTLLVGCDKKEVEKDIENNTDQLSGEPVHLPGELSLNAMIKVKKVGKPIKESNNPEYPIENSGSIFQFEVLDVYGDYFDGMPQQPIVKGFTTVILFPTENEEEVPDECIVSLSFRNRFIIPVDQEGTLKIGYFIDKFYKKLLYFPIVDDKIMMPSYLDEGEIHPIITESKFYIKKKKFNIPEIKEGSSVQDFELWIRKLLSSVGLIKK